MILKRTLKRDFFKASSAHVKLRLRPKNGYDAACRVYLQQTVSRSPSCSQTHVKGIKHVVKSEAEMW